MNRSAPSSPLPRSRRSPPPLSDDEREELARYRLWSREVAAVCRRAAEGDLEGRVLGCDPSGDIETMVLGINRLLDVTDAFVRESKAALDYASHGRCFRGG